MTMFSFSCTQSRQSVYVHDDQKKSNVYNKQTGTNFMVGSFGAESLL